MKKHLNIIFLFVFTFLLNITAFATDPPPSDFGGGDPNPTDTPAAPIDNYIWVLALVGLIFVFMKIRAIQNKKIES